MTLTRAEAAALGRKRNPVAKPRRESEIQREILRYLALVPGVTAWRNNTGAMFGEHKGKRWAVRFGKKGLPDIIGWRSASVIPAETDGYAFEPWARFLAIEVKRPGKTATPEQAAFLESVRKAGGIAFVATCVEDVQKVLPTP